VNITNNNNVTVETGATTPNFVGTGCDGSGTAGTFTVNDSSNVYFGSDLQINTLNILGASTLHGYGATRNLLVTNYNPVVTPTLDNIVMSGSCNPPPETGCTCDTLSTTGSTCTLTSDLSSPGATCFTVAAPDVTIDCAGHSISGDDTASTYGIYSNQSGTTIKNCDVRNFASAIYFGGATYGTITSTTASSDVNNHLGIYFYYSSGNIITNTTVNANGYSAIDMVQSQNNKISDIHVNNPGSYGIYLESNSSYNSISNAIVNIGGAYGIILGYSSNYNTISGSIVKAIDIPLYILASSTNNIITNTTAIATGSQAALRINSNANNNTISHSTLIANTNPITFYSSNGNTTDNTTLISSGGYDLLYLDSDSSGNTFYLDNFTQTCGKYINDLNGNNMYSSMIDGKIQGNIYYNVINGESYIPEGVASSVSGLYIGTTSYSSTNSLGRTTGMIDNAPLTIGTSGTIPGCGYVSPNIPPVAT
jgi:parallel beta-helix repeat protein